MLFSQVEEYGENANYQQIALQFLFASVALFTCFFHCARHTFGTLALTKGMPIESVSRVLGHTNIVTTQIYAKITTQKLDNDLTMFGDKLNKVFNDVSMA